MDYTEIKQFQAAIETRTKAIKSKKDRLERFQHMTDLTIFSTENGYSSHTVYVDDKSTQFMSTIKALLVSEMESDIETMTQELQDFLSSKGVK